MKVAIVARGIVGLATAIALRLRSIEADGYQQASAWEALGGGILVPRNAMQVLRHMGIASSDHQQQLTRRSLAL
jgi:2-polyprenyl-6-methoxyphenol hydroxylase-like FAD-dependent oxidoreductase